MAKRKKDLRISPLGRYVFPHLNTPDTKFDADGVYTVKLGLQGEEMEELKAEVDALMAEAAAGKNMDERSTKAYKAAMKKLKDGEEIKVADPPYTEQDEEHGGGLLFTFKMKAKGTTRNGETFTRTPKLFDAQGKECDVRIGGGTMGRISFEPYRFFTALIGAGVSLRLEAAQIVELVEWGGRSAEEFGFEAVDGFSIEDAEGNFDSGEGDEESFDF